MLARCLSDPHIARLPYAVLLRNSCISQAAACPVAPPHVWCLKRQGLQVRERLLTITHSGFPQLMQNTRIRHAAGFAATPTQCSYGRKFARGCNRGVSFKKGASRGRRNSREGAPGQHSTRRCSTRRPGFGTCRWPRCRTRPSSWYTTRSASTGSLQRHPTQSSKGGPSTFSCRLPVRTLVQQNPRAVIKRTAHHSPCQGQLPPHRDSKVFSPAAPCRSS